MKRIIQEDIVRIEKCNDPKEVLQFTHEHFQQLTEEERRRLIARYELLRLKRAVRRAKALHRSKEEKRAKRKYKIINQFKIRIPLRNKDKQYFWLTESERKILLAILPERERKERMQLYQLTKCLVFDQGLINLFDPEFLKTVKL
jgi:hypothetical protein